MMKSFLLCGALAVCSVAAHAQTRVVDETSIARATVSLGALLQLQADQSQRLNRLYEDFDERRARNLERDNSWRIADDLSSTRAKALKILSPVQRAQLQGLSNDPRYQLRADWMHQLLLARNDELAPLASERDFTSGRARRERGSRLKGIGNYGVYGGYSYGRPDIGVYGGYNQGAVGVQGGFGRGGPSIGVNIGRVFGRIR